MVEDVHDAGLDDARHHRERPVLQTVFLKQFAKRRTRRIMGSDLGTGEGEGDRIGRQFDVRIQRLAERLGERHEQELRPGVDAALDQPRRCDAIHVDVISGDPFHRERSRAVNRFWWLERSSGASGRCDESKPGSLPP